MTPGIQLRAPVDKQQAPVFFDGSPPPAELRTYSQVPIDENPTDTHSGIEGTSVKDADLPPSEEELHRYAAVELDPLEVDRQAANWRQSPLLFLLSYRIMVE